MKKIYSFDIFDTCLLRKCGSFENLYYLLAIEFLGNEANYDEIEDFVHNRISAEFYFQNLTPNLFSLEQIHRYMEEKYGICNWELLYQLELKITEQQLIGVYELVTYIEQLRQDPKNEIVFISDMYLPSSFLIKILERNKLYKKGDRLFVSCECGKTKSDGTLYDFVANQFKLKKIKNWIHFGDNSFSDITVPKRKGIKTKLIKHPYSYYENFYLKNSFFCVHRESAKILGAYLKAYRLSLPDKTYDVEFAIDVIGSLYIPYVIWLLKDAQARKIDHLLFLARDSEIFLEIAKAAKELASGIKFSYIYVSRKSLNYVLENAKHKCLFREYLVQEGVTKEENVGFVDLGWSGSSRYALGLLFHEFGFKTPYTYYWGYWGNEKPEYSPVNSVPMKAFNYLYANHEIGLPGYVFSMLFEHYFSMTEEGSTLSYHREKSGIVVPEKGSPENDTRQIVKKRYRIISELTSAIISNPAIMKDVCNIYSVVGRKICTSLLIKPTSKDINLLKDIQVSHEGNISFLIGRINFLQRLGILFTGNLYGGFSNWKLASLYNSPLRSLYAFLYPRTSTSSVGRSISNIIKKITK